MRTTITIEPDVESLLKKRMLERGLSFKDAVNGALRAGLASPAVLVDYTFQTYAMGKPAIALEHALRVASDLEDEEIVRSLNVGR